MPQITEITDRGRQAPAAQIGGSHAWILKHDPYVSFDDTMEFRLIYDGQLLGASRNNTRSEHKHEIRRVFHRQLKKLWTVTPSLRHQTTVAGRKANGPIESTAEHHAEALANRFRLGGYRLVPLATRDLDLACGIDVLFLRYDQPGQTLLQSGDLDNRLKTLFDALRIPQVGEYTGQPSSDEDPFFCLLEDDSMITQMSLTSDVLLEPARDVNDAHLVIRVKLWPTNVTLLNIGIGY
jgi:hypothetical protein